MNDIDRILDKVSIPKFAKVNQSFDATDLSDAQLHDSVRQQMQQSGLSATIQPGQTVAITGGSRGIDRIDQAIAAIVEEVKSVGGVPYIVPAMGSHGGGNAAGQREVLAHLNITEETMHAPIVSQDELVQVGSVADGRGVFVDKFMTTCDHIILINRVKKHTLFTAPVESGLQKIMAIGMGKQVGAESCHAQGPEGMYKNVTEYAEVIMNALPVIGGIALVENSYGRACYCEGVLAKDIPTREPEILKFANTKLPRICFDNLDLLIVCELGKDISGSGMDTNVTGRFASASITGVRKSDRLVVLSVTEASDGNCQGMGYADFISKRLYDKMDRNKTYITILTNNVLTPSYISPIMSDDKRTVCAGIKTGHCANPESLRAVLIRNTHALAEVYVSQGMLTELEQTPNVTLAGELMDLPFDQQGQLDFDSLFA